MQECSLFSTPSSTFIACRLFDDGHSDWCEAVSHCSFDLHFFNSKWCLASFQVLVSHLYVFFGEMSLQVLFPLFYWVVCFSKFCPFYEWHLCLGFYNVCALSCFSHVRLFATLWTVAHQAPLSMGFFSRQEFWSGLPCPPPGDLPDSGIEHLPLRSPALVIGIFTTRATWEALFIMKSN